MLSGYLYVNFKLQPCKVLTNSLIYLLIFLFLLHLLVPVNISLYYHLVSRQIFTQFIYQNQPNLLRFLFFNIIHLVLYAAAYTIPPLRGTGCLLKNKLGSISSGSEYLVLTSVFSFEGLQSLVAYLPLKM